MNHRQLRYSFIALHLALGTVILLQSIISVFHARGLPTGPHQAIGLAVLASIEAVAAALFLFPRTLKVGGVTLLIVFIMALALHALRGEFPIALIVYAAGVTFVMLHGSAYRREPLGARAAT